MNLEDLQKRLAQQYARLRDLRTTENYPVYSIEHGLTGEEYNTMRGMLNAALSSEKHANRAYWLVWVAAAAEVGYSYDGTEYWDSFSEAFPHWQDYGDRNQIRDWYKRFASEYRGLSPSGPWARQFPIIAWPITQSILPRYLQRHFAEHLYELRHLLVRKDALTLDEIGNLLNDRYYGQSSRFEGFLQQKALTARIVMAMGLENVADVVTPIERPTLERIISDFDRLGRSGSRLREARRILREARFINSHKIGFVPDPKANDPKHAKMGNRQPKLVARPLGMEYWSLAVALPDLSTPLRQCGLSPRDLEQARIRFRIQGKNNNWIPGRALFSYSGQSEESLAEYPINSIRIFDFENPHEKIEKIIGELITLTAEPIRLLKVRSDGIASEIIGRQVLAGQSYVLASSNLFDPHMRFLPTLWHFTCLTVINQPHLGL